MEQEIYEVEPGRWGYHIGGIIQEWNPEAPGFQPMTYEDAQHWSAILAARLQA